MTAFNYMVTCCFLGAQSRPGSAPRLRSYGKKESSVLPPLTYMASGRHIANEIQVTDIKKSIITSPASAPDLKGNAY